MSRHFFDCELRCFVRVTMGFDGERYEVFLQVERIGAKPELGHSPFLYASIDDPFNGGDDLDYYRDKLEKLGLVIPESLFQAVEEDVIGGVTERCAQHFADGAIVETGT